MRATRFLPVILVTMVGCATGSGAPGGRGEASRTEPGGPTAEAVAATGSEETARLHLGPIRSFSGRSVARVAGRDGKRYSPSARTRLVVARPDESHRKSYLLHGDFQPEAFSTDDNELFLIEYLSETRYRVRMMRLGSGRITPVSRLTKSAPDSMRGIGRTQIYAPDGKNLYTLYTKQPPNTAHRSLASYEDRGRVHAFVHVLNLQRGWAHCVDLPHPFGNTERPANEIAVSADGRYVYVGDSLRTAIVDTKTLRVVDVVDGASIEDLAGPVSVPKQRHQGTHS